MAFSEELDVRITDTSLRDGSHHNRHTFTVSQVRSMVSALDQAGIPVIEVAHGDGLGGSSFNYGFSAVDERSLIAAAVDCTSNARIACLMLPGVGTKDDIRAMVDLGAGIVRVATHCTEADVAVQHFGLAREVGLETVGFLMMSHTVSPATLARQARVMADAGCQCVYVVDSAGAMVLEQVTRRVEALVLELGSDATVGFHGHENLAIATANTVCAVRGGAVQVDGSTRRFGAGAGNTPTEALVAVLDNLGYATGIDPLAMFDVAEDVVRPVMDAEPTLSRLALIMGYAGVYSSFLNHAFRAAEKYEVSGAEILLECANRRLVGGQEDQIIEIAAGMSQASAAPQGSDAAKPD